MDRENVEHPPSQTQLYVCGDKFFKKLYPRMRSAAQADRDRGPAVRVAGGEAREREGGGGLQGLQRQAGGGSGLVPQQRPLQPGQRCAHSWPLAWPPCTDILSD